MVVISASEATSATPAGTGSVAAALTSRTSLLRASTKPISSVLLPALCAISRRLSVASSAVYVRLFHRLAFNCAVWNESS